MTILADGTSTIKVTNPVDGVTLAQDDQSRVAVRVDGDSVILGVEGLPPFATIAIDKAWSLRDVLARALDESCAPAKTE